MEDQGFNFAPPPPRRERKEFEPPPWEKNEFDRLAQERREVAGEGAEQAPEEAAGPQEREEAKVVQAQVAPPKVPAVNDEVPLGGAVDEHKIAAMLSELRAEDAPATRAVKTASVAAGAVLFLIGMMLVTWGVVMIAVATRRPEQGGSGVFVGLTIMMFGAGFAGIGAWFVFRTLRQQGVL